MIKNVATKKSMVYAIDLMKIEGDGAFPCPKCEALISPDDRTEKNYKIVETKVSGDELLELVLMCNKCGSTIKLEGFLLKLES